MGARQVQEGFFYVSGSHGAKAYYSNCSQLLKGPYSASAIFDAIKIIDIA